MMSIYIFFILLFPTVVCYPLLTTLTSESDALYALQLFSRMPNHVPYVAIGANYWPSNDILRKLHAKQARILYAANIDRPLVSLSRLSALSTWLPYLHTLSVDHILVAPPISSVTSLPSQELQYAPGNDPILLCFKNSSSVEIPSSITSFIASYAGLHLSTVGYIVKSAISCSGDVLILRTSTLNLLLSEIQRLVSNLQHYRHLYTATDDWDNYNIELYIIEAALVSLQLPINFLEPVTYVLSPNALPLTIALNTAPPTPSLLPAHIIDFIEIGTSDAGSCIEGMSVGQRGISIEPVAEQLFALPNKSNVLKLPYAVAGSTNNSALQFSYLSYDTIEQYALPRVLLQQGQLHPLTESLPPSFHDILRAYNLPRSAITTIPISLITFEEIFQRYHNRTTDFPSTNLRLLKIDAEGYDFRILEAFFDFISSNSQSFSFPCTLLFEVLNIPHNVLLPWLETHLTPRDYNVYVRNSDAVATHPNCSAEDFEMIAPLLGPIWCGYDVVASRWDCGTSYIRNVLNDRAPLYF